MKLRRFARVAIGCLGIPLGFGALAAQQPEVLPPAAAEVQVQFADLLFADGRFRDAREAYRRATTTTDAVLAARASAGIVLTRLRVGDFRAALVDSEALMKVHPEDSLMLAVHGDALWGSGMFQEAEASYDRSLALDPSQARARSGHARSLLARNQLDSAMAEAQEAVRLAPRDGEFHNTVGTIHQRMHHFKQAAASYTNYVNLLPDRDRGDRAVWARESIKFLESFNNREPFDFADQPVDRSWTVPVRLIGDKVLVRARVNGANQEFVLDTGAEQTVISRDFARRAGVAPITYTESAGVGDIGFRGLQIGRIDVLEIGQMKVRNVPTLIKNPPIGGLPGREPESFSPLALGLSMQIDYGQRRLTMSRKLPAANYGTELPLRMARLATVRGTVNGSLPASFVVDTGGEVISISGATADLMSPPNPYRRIPLKVYGTSGWDKEAFLMPFVDLEFNSIRFSGIPVVVLNLRAPSALLGYQLGGIVGHKFLSKYRVTVDLDRSVLGLDAR
jgi:predicted aspartyl protease/Flp pilus assembly protein TadD